MGTLLVRKSGKLQLRIGDQLMDVSPPPHEVVGAAVPADAPASAAEAAGAVEEQVHGGTTPMQPMRSGGSSPPAAARCPPRPRVAQAGVDKHRLRRTFEVHLPEEAFRRWKPRQVHPSLAGTAAFRMRAEYSTARQLVAIVTDHILRDSVDCGGDGQGLFKLGYDRGRADVESASLLNATYDVGAWGVAPRYGSALRVLVTMSSDAAAAELINARHRLKRLIPGCHIFEVLSAEERQAHQVLWPIFQAARAEGKKAQFRRARLLVDGVEVLPGVPVVGGVEVT